MNRTISKYISLITVLSFAFASCEKYLDVKSNNSLVVPSSLEDLQALLDDANLMNFETPSIGEASSDDYFVLNTAYTSMNEQSQKTYTWKYFTYSWPSDWSKSYSPIYNSNLCLERLGQVDISTTNRLKWNNVKGSALFYRSYYYLKLSWVYAKAFDNTTADTDLGIVLRTQSDLNVPSKRATVRECYTKIIDDTKEAAAYLPDISQHPLRPSKAAAYALLARTYLSMRQYDSTLKYSNLCLQLYSQLMDYNGDTGVGATTSNTPFAKFNKETIFYTEITAIHQSVNPTRALIDSTVYLSFNTKDRRRALFFRAATGYQRFKGNYSENQTKLFGGIATDEVLLMRAESLLRTGNMDGLKDLNALLIKRWTTGSFVPVTAGTPAEALSIVLAERRKELLMRGLRWMDIKRLNKEGAGIIPTRKVNNELITLQPNSGFYALPLPLDVVEQAGIPQN